MSRGENGCYLVLEIEFWDERHYEKTREWAIEYAKRIIQRLKNQKEGGKPHSPWGGRLNPVMLVGKDGKAVAVFGQSIVPEQKEVLEDLEIPF